MLSRITPDEPFPDLTELPTRDIEVLNSKVHREVHHEYRTTGQVHPETEFRQEVLDDELDIRDLLDTPSSDSGGNGGGEGGARPYLASNDDSAVVEDDSHDSARCRQGPDHAGGTRTSPAGA